MDSTYIDDIKALHPFWLLIVCYSRLCGRWLVAGGTSVSSNEQTVGWTELSSVARNSNFCHRKLTSVEKEKEGNYIVPPFSLFFDLNLTAFLYLPYYKYFFTDVTFWFFLFNFGCWPKRMANLVNAYSLFMPLIIDWCAAAAIWNYCIHV